MENKSFQDRHKSKQQSSTDDDQQICNTGDANGGNLNLQDLGFTTASFFPPIGNNASPLNYNLNYAPTGISHTDVKKSNYQQKNATRDQFIRANSLPVFDRCPENTPFLNTPFSDVDVPIPQTDNLYRDIFSEGGFETTTSGSRNSQVAKYGSSSTSAQQIYRNLGIESPVQPQLNTNGKPKNHLKRGDHELVQLALRKRCCVRKRKEKVYRTKKPIGKHNNHKKAIKIGRPLNPKTRIKLTLVPNLMSLHSMLVPTHRSEDIRVLSEGEIPEKERKAELTMDKNVKWKFRPNQHGSMFPGKAYTITLVDKDYVPTNSEKKGIRYETGGAIGYERSRSKNGEVGTPIYNDFKQAVEELFQIDNFSLVRVTRAAALEKTGAVVLKLETSHPGDRQLNDEDEDVDNSRRSDEDDVYLGKRGDPIGPLFIKKKIARPRYKANMRIYLIPRDTRAVLYSQESMLERDLVKGVLDLQTDPRLVLCAFDYRNLLKRLNMVPR